MGVLEDCVMAAVVRRRAYIHSLLFCDFFRADQTRGVTGAGCCYGGIEGVGEGVA